MDTLLERMYKCIYHFAELTLQDGSIVRGYVYTVLNPYDDEDIGDQSMIVMILDDGRYQDYPEGDLSDIAPWSGPAWKTISSRQPLI